MGLFDGAEQLMAMDDSAWRRHANPWSVWSRFATQPLLALAVWSRVWIDWWSLVAVVAVLTWVWINPRAFPPPAAWDSWASRATLGERIWLRRSRLDLPRHHLRAVRVLTVITAAGVPPMVWGLAILDAAWTVAGTAIVMLGKAWLADRMVWLHRDVTGPGPGTPLPDPEAVLR